VIVQSLIDWVGRMLAGLLDTIPDLSNDGLETMASLPGNVAAVVEYVGRLAPVLPFTQINIALGVVLAAWAAAAGIALARQIMGLAVSAL